MSYGSAPEIFPPAVIEIARLRRHLQHSSEIITKAQAILEQYLVPNGKSSAVTINSLLGLLDNREIVQRQAEWAAALAKFPP